MRETLTPFSEPEKPSEIIFNSLIEKLNAEKISDPTDPRILAILQTFTLEDEEKPFFSTEPESLKSLVEVLTKLTSKTGFKEALQVTIMVNYGTRNPHKSTKQRGFFWFK